MCLQHIRNNMLLQEPTLDTASFGATRLVSKERSCFECTLELEAIPIGQDLDTIILTKLE
jgi:hypothetical protein